MPLSIKKKKRKMERIPTHPTNICVQQRFSFLVCRPPFIAGTVHVVCEEGCEVEEEEKRNIHGFPPPPSQPLPSLLILNHAEFFFLHLFLLSTSFHYFHLTPVLQEKQFNGSVHAIIYRVGLHAHMRVSLCICSIPTSPSFTPYSPLFFCFCF